MPATTTRVLSVARSQLGITEPGSGGGPGTQVTKYGRWYAAWSGQPGYVDTFWCAMFASWVLATAGMTPTEAGRYGNCNPWIRWFKARGRWGENPRPGAIVFFSWNGDSRAEHVGIVETVRPNGKLVTIEGNASPGPGQRDGVCRMVRGRGAVVGYGYPPYLSGTQESAIQGVGGSRAGYPTLVRGAGGIENTGGNVRWWVAQWFRLMARWSPGYFRQILSDPEGKSEVDRMEMGPVSLAVSKRMATEVLGDSLQWEGAITRQLWAIYPPVI
jgi:surface antigen